MLELGSLGLTEGALEIRILFDDVGEYVERVGLILRIQNVTGGLHQPHNVLLLYELGKCEFVFCQFGKNLMCVEAGLEVFLVLRAQAVNQVRDDLLPLQIQDFDHALLNRGEMLVRVVVFGLIVIIVRLVIEVRTRTAPILSGG